MMVKQVLDFFPRDSALCSESGDPVKIEYIAVHDNNGSMYLEESGKTDLYSYIQSFKDSCDINVLIKRFAAGDSSALTQKQGFYGDVTDIPKSYAELLNLTIRGQQAFDQLPIDEKSKYGNSYIRWLDEVMPYPTPAGVNNPSPISQVEGVDIAPAAAPAASGAADTL